MEAIQLVEWEGLGEERCLGSGGVELRQLLTNMGWAAHASAHGPVMLVGTARFPYRPKSLARKMINMYK